MLRVFSHDGISENIQIPRGVLNILVRQGVCRFSGYRLRLFFMNRVSKEGKSSGAGDQKMSKGKILIDLVIL